jgi:hypothetical protein
MITADETFMKLRRLQPKKRLCQLPEGLRMTHKLKYLLVTVLLIGALSFTFERRAYAYVDPGSGLLIFQGISAVVSGTLIYFRRRIKGLFVKSQPNTGTSVADPS